MRKAQAQRVIDAFAAQAVKRANDLPESEAKADAEAHALALVKSASEPDPPLNPVLTPEQAKAMILSRGWL